MGRPFPAACERAREQVSRDLDGELTSGLERASLDAHLARCSACRAFDAQLSGQTYALRLAPSERPALEVAVPARRRYVSLRAVQAAAAAAGIAIAAGLGSMGVTGAAPEAASPYANLSPTANFRGDEIVPGHVPRVRGIARRDRIAL